MTHLQLTDQEMVYRDSLITKLMISIINLLDKRQPGENFNFIQHQVIAKVKFALIIMSNMEKGEL